MLEAMHSDKFTNNSQPFLKRIIYFCNFLGLGRLEDCCNEPQLNGKWRLLRSTFHSVEFAWRLNETRPLIRPVRRTTWRGARKNSFSLTVDLEPAQVLSRYHQPVRRDHFNWKIRSLNVKRSAWDALEAFRNPLLNSIVTYCPPQWGNICR